MKKTTIQISEKTWKRLNSIKKLGEDYDSIISTLLDMEDRKK